MADVAVDTAPRPVVARGGQMIYVRRWTVTRDEVDRSTYLLDVVTPDGRHGVTVELDEDGRRQLTAALDGAAPPDCPGCQRHERRRRWTSGEFERLYALIAELRAAAVPVPTPPMCRRPEEASR